MPRNYNNNRQHEIEHNKPNSNQLERLQQVADKKLERLHELAKAPVMQKPQHYSSINGRADIARRSSDNPQGL